MRDVIAGVERTMEWREPNVIECDKCGIWQTLERHGHHYGLGDALSQARGYGWSCEGDPRVDLCPKCVGEAA